MVDILRKWLKCYDLLLVCWKLWLTCILLILKIDKSKGGYGCTDEQWILQQNAVCVTSDTESRY